MNLEFGELRKRCEMNDSSDASLPAWKNSTGYHSITPGRPFLAYKRKNLDESNASNETFVVKRARMDDEMADDSEIANETVVNKAVSGCMDDGTSQYLSHPDDDIENEGADFAPGIIWLYSKLMASL